jgi:hypothetical protein
MATQQARRGAHEEVDGSDVDDMMNEWEQQQSRKDRFAPRQAATFNIRILPPPVRGKFYKPFALHYNLDIISPAFPDDIKSCLCRKAMFEEDCPICRFSAEMYRQSRNEDGSKNQVLVNKGTSAKPRKRYVCNVINLDNPSLGVLTWEFSGQTFDILMPIFREYGDVTHSKSGRGLIVKFEKQKEWVIPSSIIPKGKESPIDYPNWQTGRKDLEAYALGYELSAEKIEQYMSAGSKKRSARRHEPEETDGSDDPMEVGGDADNEDPPIRTDAGSGAGDHDTDDPMVGDDGQAGDDDDAKLAKLAEQNPDIKSVIERLKRGGK